MACPDPPSVANGYISSQNASSVTYACNDLFGLSGYATVTCTAGVWGALPYCYTSWNRNKNNYIKGEEFSSIPEDLSEEVPDYIVYVAIGTVGAFILALLAGLLLCWLHQIGCYDGPAVGFGGSYVYADRRCCYVGDLNVKGCNFKCGMCRARCCRYFRKKSHGKVHFQTTPTPEEVALQKLLMKKKKKLKFTPVPCCLRFGRCLLACLLCCCRWKRRKAKLAKLAALAEEEKLTNVAAEEPSKKEGESTVIQVQSAEEEPVPPKEEKVFFPQKPKPPEEEPKKEPEKKPEKPPPPLMEIREPPKKPKKPVPSDEKVDEPAKKKPEKPLMVIQAPPKKPKKKNKPVQPIEKKKENNTESAEFVAVLESTDNPFGNNDIAPSKRAAAFQANNTPSKIHKGNKVASDPSMGVTRLTYQRTLNTKVTKLNDMNNDELWKKQPQQNLFAPEAPIKTRKTEQVIPLTSFLNITEKSGKKQKEKSKTKTQKKKEEEEGEFVLPTAGKKSTSFR
ncbi:neurofilament heavy polypeptide-like isoform X2 [Argopecten irradians]|uniref:neurofilament heavy polypeptide-like isoform X2 n=1 Tax=Argopecten irradians TaxID=31199 RepID=UPI003711DEF2